MTRNLTIFAKSIKHDYVVDILESLKIKFDFEGSVENWEKISFTLNNEAVKINSLIKVEQGDKFSNNDFRLC